MPCLPPVTNDLVNGFKTFQPHIQTVLNAAIVSRRLAAGAGLGAVFGARTAGRPRLPALRQQHCGLSLPCRSVAGSCSAPHGRHPPPCTPRRAVRLPPTARRCRPPSLPPTQRRCPLNRTSTCERPHRAQGRCPCACPGANTPRAGRECTEKQHPPHRLLTARTLPALPSHCPACRVVQNLQAIFGTQVAALRLCTLAARYANETGCDVSLWGYRSGIWLDHWCAGSPPPALPAQRSHHRPHAASTVANACPPGARPCACVVEAGEGPAAERPPLPPGCCTCPLLRHRLPQQQPQPLHACGCAEQPAGGGQVRGAAALDALQAQCAACNTTGGHGSLSAIKARD